MKLTLNELSEIGLAELGRFVRAKMEEYAKQWTPHVYINRPPPKCPTIEDVVCEFLEDLLPARLDPNLVIESEPLPPAEIDPHAECKAAFERGERIEYLDQDRWLHALTPVWNPHREYRVAPVQNL